MVMSATESMTRIRLRGLLIVFVGLIAGFLLLVVLAYVWLNSRTNGELISSGETRKYLLHVPESYEPSVPAPLVISLHGAFLWPRSQMRISGWNELAEKEGFIVVYPKAHGFPAVWRMEPGEALATEIRFFADLIDELSQDFNIDPARVFANGYSNGAAMTITLACGLPERIAAFGMVAVPVLPWEWCPDPRPAPVIVFSGTRDPFVPYEGGEHILATEAMLSMREWLSLWGQRNACNADPVDTTLGLDLAVRQYLGCAQGTAVTLYSLEGAGHIWPGGMRFPGDLAGPYSASVDATQVMWAFFQNHALTQRHR
jgi:polyhydroxybutyrate depolymerase